MIWILLLTVWAGYMNSLALMTFSKTVSHHTGNLTNLGISLATGDALSNEIQLLIVPFAYVVGAISSEVIFGQLSRNRRHLSKRLSFILVAIGFGLIALNDLSHPTYLMFFFSFLMGGQNGYSLQVFNKLVRTTHMTGYLTDLGILVGKWIRDRRTNMNLLLFYLGSLFLFVLGSALAVFMAQIVTWSDHMRLVAIGYIASGILLAIRTYQLVGIRK